MERIEPVGRPSTGELKPECVFDDQGRCGATRPAWVPTPATASALIPRPTECLKHEKPDGLIEELCTSANPDQDPEPTPVKIRPAMQERIDKHKRWQESGGFQGGSSDEAAHFPVRVIPQRGQRDSLITWLESLGHKAEKSQYGSASGEFVIWITDPLFLEQLAERDEVWRIDEPALPEEHTESNP